MAPLFEVRNLRRDVADRNILTNISFALEPGQILFVRGPSGVGKSLLLRALACLDQPQGGTLLLHGSPPPQMGYPAWRTAVSYVPQSRATSLRGTPAELYFQAQRFAAQRARPRGDLPALVAALGLEQVVLNQQWAELSGGQSQRVALALALALGPSVLLLDEPTSACDPLSTLRVERVLATCGAALVWVTHDPHQPARVSGRILDLPLATLVHLPPPPPLPPTSLPPPSPPPPLSATAADSSSASGGAADIDVSGSAISGGGGAAASASAAKHSSLPGPSLALLGDHRGSGVNGGGGGIGGSIPVGTTGLAPAGRPAELLDCSDGDLPYGYPDVLSPPSPQSPPSPSALRGPQRGVP